MRTLLFYIVLFSGWIVALSIIGVYFYHQRNKSTAGTAANQISSLENSNTTVRGLSISHWDGSISWADLKKYDSIDFVILKATEGRNLVDASFSQNWEKASDFGFIKGAYHYFDPELEATEQATHFLQTVDFSQGDLRPVLDFETTGNKSFDAVEQEVLQWLTLVENSIGCKPIIYTNHAMWKGHKDSELLDYPLWIADWHSSLSPLTPTDWDYSLWQFTCSAHLKGLAQEVCLTKMRGDKRTLAAFLI